LGSNSEKFALGGFSGLMHSSFSDVMLSELRRDRLITDMDNYSAELSPKKLKVNGKKQPAVLHKKYLEMYKSHTGKEMTGNDAIAFSVKR